jgi:hypothetical protein
VYAWCYEGIIEIDGGGVEVVSTPIEPTLQALYYATGFDFATTASFATAGFAVAYRQGHRVLFFYPEAVVSANLKGCGKWLVFDTRTRAWTTGSPKAADVSGYYDQRSCGVVRWNDDRLILASWNNASSDAYLFLERRTYSASDYLDTDATGTNYAINAALTLQYQQPDATGAVHWQRVTTHFEAGEFSDRPLPSSVTITMSTDGSGASVTVTPTVYDTTIEVPSPARRGKRCQITIADTTNSSNLGVIGIEIMLADEAPTRAKRV